MQDCLIELNLDEVPTIAGTGVTVAIVLERLSLDDTIETICSDHHLTREQVHAALSYAERNLFQSKHYEALDSLLKEVESDDEIDYALLAANAGYFSADSCPLHLLHRYRKRARHVSHKNGDVQ
jgi:uncharacterized protein (DUF433 family)